MKKTAFCAALLSVFCSAPVIADTLTHCPLTADVKLLTTNGHPHSTGALTTYEKQTVAFHSIYFYRDQAVAYFKHAWLEPSEQNKNELHMHCVYVYQNGGMIDLNPIYANIYAPERMGSGTVGERWIYDESNKNPLVQLCNSQNPADCMFYVK